MFREPDNQMFKAIKYLILMGKIDPINTGNLPDENEFPQH